MFGAVLGYVVLFRVVQYMLFAYQTGSFDGLAKRLKTRYAMMIAGNADQDSGEDDKLAL